MTDAPSLNTSDAATSPVDQRLQPGMQLVYSSRTIGSSNLLENVENSDDGDNVRLSPPTHKRRLSASYRRRQRPVHQMESIFEDAADNHLDLESYYVSGQHTTTVNTHDAVSNASTSSSSSSVRRRRSFPVNSTSSSSGSRTSSTRRRRLGQDLTNQASEHAGNTHDTQRRSGSRSSGLSTSLDAGMRSLRKWIRSHKFAADIDSAETSSGQSSTMRLGEEDISALSRAGNDTVPITTTASSASGDSGSTLFQHGGDNGFLYYRPNEVHLRHDVDDGLDSTDLFFPLVNLSQEVGLRHRAYSEPDRTQVAGFFLNSVYSSRAIDTGGASARDESSSTVSQSVAVTDSSVSVVEEGNTTTHQEPEHIQSISTLQTSNDHISLSASDSIQSTADNDVVAESRTNVESTSLTGSTDESNINDANNEIIIDPDRDARMRWLQINRRFRCIISSVALAFSFLLFLFLVAWVVLIATYILSLPKTCDVPLKAYFWLATLQLALDFFRAEIMKWICRWSTNSRGGVPLRVLLYNIAYLIYAMLVLRLGITCVFVGESTCYDTAPELFLASAVFVCLTLLAWTLIIVGYILPFAAVAVLLIRNGYFPNEDLDALNGTEGNRRALLLGILPNNLANPAPPDCVEKLRVIMYDEINDSFQKECCICLMDYGPGDGIVATPCDHMFHKVCCKEWLQLSRSCPICRRDIVDGLGEGSTLEEGAVDSRRSNNPTERRTSRNWQRDASNLLQFLRSPRATSETSNGN